MFPTTQRSTVLTLTLLLTLTNSLDADIFIFQDGTEIFGGGPTYSGTQDAEIRSQSGNVDTNFGSANQINIDGSDGGGVNQGLFQFTGVIGNSAGQIPLGSTINSATFSVFNTGDTGSNMEVHPILGSWNQASVTWNNFTLNGNSMPGIQPDAIEAGATLGTLGGSGSPASVNATSAVQSWAEGNTNGGFGLISNGTGGVTWWTSEDGTATRRPSLTVDFTPGRGAIEVAGANNVGSDSSRGSVSTSGSFSTFTFQEGVDGYLGMEDTELRSQAGNVNTNYGNASQMNIDNDDGGGVNQGLFRFNNIFGNGPGQIPEGSDVVSAEFSLFNANDTGSSMEVYRILGDGDPLTQWTESSATWNNFQENGNGLPGIQADGVEADSTSLGTLPGSGTPATLDVQSAVQAWSDGEENNGFGLISNGSGGVTWYTSEHGTASQRPLLTVEAGQVTDVTTTLDSLPYLFEIDASGTPVADQLTAAVFDTATRTLDLNDATFRLELIGDLEDGYYEFQVLDADAIVGAFAEFDLPEIDDVSFDVSQLVAGGTGILGVQVGQVPEPTSLAAFGMLLTAGVYWRRRRTGKRA